MSAQGKVVREGDRVGVRFERRLGHPPARVWAALTEAEDLAAWFPTMIEGERRAGATLRFVFPGEEEMPVTEGKILVYDPARTLEYTWGGDVLRFELIPDGDGCRLVFTTTFAERAEASRNATGWQGCLDNLYRRLDGEPRAAEAPSWAGLFAEYQDLMGLGDFPKFVHDAGRTRFLTASEQTTLDEQLAAGAYLAVMEGTATLRLHGVEVTIAAGKEFVAPPGKLTLMLARGTRAVFVVA